MVVGGFTPPEGGVLGNSLLVTPLTPNLRSLTLRSELSVES